MIQRSLSVLAIALLAAAPGTSFAQDWPQWGRDASKNMVGPSKNIPTDIKAGQFKDGTETVDMATTKNVKWIAKLGSESYGNPTILNGRVYVGTNNSTPRDPKYKGDYSMLYCLSEQTGELIWQFASPKLGTGKVSDWEFLGICSSPTIDGERIYIVTNRCQVVCLDTQGLANGNDGPFKDEAKYYANNGKPAVKLGDKDADIIWTYDLRAELEVFPHNITSSSILVVGDMLFVNTSNGVDWSHVNIPNPRAPVLIALNKKTGKYLGEEISGMSTRIFHGNWSSPAYGKVGGKDQVVFASGDGFCYGFEVKPATDEDGEPYLKELWRCDGNPKSYRVDEKGEPRKYATPPGPSEFVASPVIYKEKVYIPIGQDPEHGEGVGNLLCIDPKGKSGDITATGIVWNNDKIHRSISTVSILDDLIYVGDFSGFIYCFEAKTGKQLWKHDTQGHIWASTLVTDNKVICGNADGYLTILKTGKEKKVLAEVEFPVALYSSAVVANDTVYIASQTHLYAIAMTEKTAKAKPEKGSDQKK